jgi:purine-binding chemotaxis protein CheW
MVDLAKIRKKAKKSAPDVLPTPSGSEGEGPVREVAVAPAPEAPPVEPPAAQVPRDARDDMPSPSKLERFKEQAGKRREAEAAAAAEQVAESGTAQLELLTFAIAGEQYAVDIERIVEIVTPRSLTRIPNADPSIVGIMSLRGTIVTLVDVRRKLRHPAAGAGTPDTRIVVVDYFNEMVGFVVDRVLRVVKTAAADIEPHPVVHATELDESLRGVFRVNDALTILLDLDKLLDSRALAATTA